jgi:hypothetical protein
MRMTILPGKNSHEITKFATLDGHASYQVRNCCRSRCVGDLMTHSLFLVFAQG